MVEGRQDITLHHKATHDALGIHAPLDDLERNCLLKAFARRQVNGAHAAATDFLYDSIGANDRAGRNLVGGDQLRSVGKSIPFEKTLPIGVLISCQDCFSLTLQTFIAGASLSQKLALPIRLELERGRENFIQSLPLA
jgi:hypothetical protein